MILVLLLLLCTIRLCNHYCNHIFCITCTILIIELSACQIIDNLILISNRLWAQPKDLTVVTLILLLFEKSRMAESKLTVAVVPLNSTNYSTWKIQCKMAMISLGYCQWNRNHPYRRSGKTVKVCHEARQSTCDDCVTAVEPSLLYLIGSDPTNPVVVWRILADQFQCKTWANKLELKQNFFSLWLAKGGSVQEHVKLMTEICEELSVIGEAISEEDRVVYLLASLPESY